MTLKGSWHQAGNLRVQGLNPGRSNPFLSFAYVPALYFLKDIHKMEVRNRTENVAEFATISYHSPTFDYQTFELNELSGHDNADLHENRSSLMEGTKKISCDTSVNTNPFRKDVATNPFLE